MLLQYRPDATYNARTFRTCSHRIACQAKRVRKRVYMYKSNTRNAFTCLSKCVCTPDETRLHVWQNTFARSCECACIIRCIWAVLYVLTQSMLSQSVSSVCFCHLIIYAHMFVRIPLHTRANPLQQDITLCMLASPPGHTSYPSRDMTV